MPLLRTIVVSALLLSPCLAADQLGPVLAKIDTAAAAFQSLTADLTKLDYQPIIDIKETETASLALVKGRKSKEMKALLDFKAPNPRRISFSGTKVQVYYPAMNQIDEYDLEKKYGSVIDKYLLLGFGSSSKELEQAYAIKYGGPEPVAGQKATRLELTPKKEDTALHLVKVDLWISDETGTVVQQKLYIRGGEYHLITYTNEKINPNLPDSALNLNAPKDAKKQHPLK